MKRLSAQLDFLSVWIICLVVFLIPLFISQSTTDYYEAPKVILLLAAVIALLILKSLSWLFQGRVFITRTPLDLPLLLFLAVVLISALAEPSVLHYSKSITLLGNLPRIHGSAVTWLIYGCFFFLITFNLRTKQQVKYLLLSLTASATLVSLISILAFFNIYLPGDFTHAANFTPTGSTFITLSLIYLLLPLTLMGINKPTVLKGTLALVLSCIFAITIAITADVTSWGISVLYLAPLVIIYLLLWKHQPKAKLLTFTIPLILVVVIIGLGKLPASNAISNKLNYFPHELILPVNYAWKVAAGSFGDSALLGSGPDTFIDDFTFYKPDDINSTPLWNIRFDSSFNEFLQVFTTEGLLGLVALLFLSLVALNFAWKTIQTYSDDPLSQALAVSVVIGIILLLLHTSSVVTIIALIVILGALMASRKNLLEKISELTVGLRNHSSSTAANDALPAVVMALVLVISIATLVNSVLVIRADMHHRAALDQVDKSAANTYNELVEAEKLNPYVDLYHTNLAKTNFSVANSLAQAKTASGSALSDTEKQNIQQLLSQSINEARVATALNPLSSSNWETLGSIYRQINGVAANSLSFALDAYGHAIQRDPFNPLLRMAVGQMYYSAKQYDLAIRFFTDAINLKPDYANGYYNMAIAYKDKGDLLSAQAAAEKAVSLIDPKSSDYDTATALLNDIKNNTTTKTNNSNGNLTSPNQTNAIQNSGLSASPSASQK